MRALPLILSLMLASFPAVQAYGKTLADTHCRANGHLSGLAPDAAHDPIHAQHHAPDASVHAQHAADADQPRADAAHCQCGCLCNLACAGAVALAVAPRAAAAAPAHEPWQAVTDARRPVAVHESLLRPPRSLLS